MDIKTTISISEARKRIFEIADEVQTPGKHYTLTEKGRPKAVVMSAEEFESWIETMEVMREFPDIKKDVARVERDIKTGAYKHYTTLEQLMKKEGYVLAEKANKKYVPSTPRTSSKKGARKSSKA